MIIREGQGVNMPDASFQKLVKLNCLYLHKGRLVLTNVGNLVTNAAKEAAEREL